MNIDELICEIINQYRLAFNGGVSKTKLLKLAYLVEVFFKRRFNKRLTDAEWVYFLYGPYLYNYDKILENQNIAIENTSYSDEKEAQIISLKDTYNNKDILSDSRSLISKIVREYGDWDLKKLLDYVYFETEPMINAENRREELDFECVLPEDYYKVKELKIEPSMRKQLNKELREKVEALYGKRNN
jgi:uncharacterized phage-associated protein